MSMLGIDVGSSSVKAAILNGSAIAAQSYVPYPSRRDGVRAEVRPADLFKALVDAIAQLGAAAKGVDWINFATMAPAWVGMDRRGRPITPIVTHQDRRAVAEARDIERCVGARRHLKIAGNRPFPGGISSTIWLWFARNQPRCAQRIDLVGHVSTLLIRQFTGTRRIDPSNAAFMGLYETTTLGGWSDELCAAVGVPRHVLPEIGDADSVAGVVTAAAAGRLGLRAGTPVLCGMVDTSSAFFLTELRAGQLLNVCGSTDVLALLVERPRPDARLLTRPLGIGRRWLSVSTLAATGSTLAWVRAQFFADLSDGQYRDRIVALARHKTPPRSPVTFEPYLAGDRMSIDQRWGALGKLTLASTRDDILSAVVGTLTQRSAQRLEQLARNKGPILPQVLVSGGEREGVDKVLRRQWPGTWRYRLEPDATVRGLGMVRPALAVSERGALGGT